MGGLPPLPAPPGDGTVKSEVKSEVKPEVKSEGSNETKPTLLPQQPQQPAQQPPRQMPSGSAALASSQGVISSSGPSTRCARPASDASYALGDSCAPPPSGRQSRVAASPPLLPVRPMPAVYRTWAARRSAPAAALALRASLGASRPCPCTPSCTPSTARTTSACRRPVRRPRGYCGGCSCTWTSAAPAPTRRSHLSARCASCGRRCTARGKTPRRGNRLNPASARCNSSSSSSSSSSSIIIISSSALILRGNSRGSTAPQHSRDSWRLGGRVSSTLHRDGRGRCTRRHFGRSCASLTRRR